MAAPGIKTPWLSCTRRQNEPAWGTNATLSQRSEPQTFFSSSIARTDELSCSIQTQHLGHAFCCLFAPLCLPLVPVGKMLDGAPTGYGKIPGFYVRGDMAQLGSFKTKQFIKEGTYQSML